MTFNVPVLGNVTVVAASAEAAVQQVRYALNYEDLSEQADFPLMAKILTSLDIDITGVCQLENQYGPGHVSGKEGFHLEPSPDEGGREAACTGDAERDAGQ